MPCKVLWTRAPVGSTLGVHDRCSLAMTRRKSRTESKPKWDFADSQVLTWASSAHENRERFLRRASAWPQERCEALNKFIQRLFSRRMENRGLLQRLARALRSVPQFRSDRAEEKRQEAERLKQSESNRKALAAVAKSHPKGYLIGATQITGYKSPGTKKHWGTKRKRKR